MLKNKGIVQPADRDICSDIKFLIAGTGKNFFSPAGVLHIRDKAHMTGKDLLETLREEDIKAKHDIRHTLAIDRTVLANERTLLSYTRTSLTLIVPGVSFLHFSESLPLKILSILFIPLGLFAFFFGYYRFNKKKAAIRQEREALVDLLRKEYCRIN